MFERCNFACLELAGYMPIQCKYSIHKINYFILFYFIFYLVEEVFNDLTEKELCEHLNGIALPLEEQKQIKNDVKNLLKN